MYEVHILWGQMHAPANGEPCYQKVNDQGHWERKCMIPRT